MLNNLDTSIYTLSENMYNFEKVDDKKYKLI